MRVYAEQRVRVARSSSEQHSPQSESLRFLAVTVKNEDDVRLKMHC